MDLGPLPGHRGSFGALTALPPVRASLRCWYPAVNHPESPAPEHLSVFLMPLRNGPGQPAGSRAPLEGLMLGKGGRAHHWHGLGHLCGTRHCRGLGVSRQVRWGPGGPFTFSPALLRQRQQAGSGCAPLLHPRVAEAAMLGAVLSEGRVGTPVGGKRPEPPKPSRSRMAAHCPCSPASDEDGVGRRSPGPSVSGRRHRVPKRGPVGSPAEGRRPPRSQTGLAGLPSKRLEVPSRPAPAAGALSSRPLGLEALRLLLGQVLGPTGALHRLA